MLACGRSLRLLALKSCCESYSGLTQTDKQICGSERPCSATELHYNHVCLIFALTGCCLQTRSSHPPCGINTKSLSCFTGQPASAGVFNHCQIKVLIVM